MSDRPPPVESWPVVVVGPEVRDEVTDAVVVEEPLEIAVRDGDDGPVVPLTATLRTPGADAELAAGLLYAEGLIHRSDDLIAIRPGALAAGASFPNRLEVRLRRGLAPDPSGSARTFISTAACGLCGKVAVEAMFAQGFPPLRPGAPRVTRRLLGALPDRMRAAQALFARTGGLHAAALFAGDGELRVLHEDVGRHNAVDKVIGALVVAGHVPAADSILVVSGRAGFEITQKALRAGIPILAAVGAPSSLSLRLAARAGMTLIGFVRSDRFNIYTAPGRVAE
jgi:FdhD protein